MTTSALRSRVMLGDMEDSPRRSAHPPVDVADAISGNELADIGELDPIAALAGDHVAGLDLGFQRPQDRAQCLRPGIDPQPQVANEGALEEQ